MRPLATYALFAYRHEAFVTEAIRAVAAQTYRPMELVIVDDASPDATRARIADALAGFPADIPVRRIDHEANLGLAAAINAAVRAAAGRVLVFGAGDDISAPERVARTMEAFREPGVTFVHTATLKIDEQGRPLPDQPALSADRPIELTGLIHGAADPVVGASCAYAAEVFADFDELPRAILREDAILPLRALLLGQGRFLAARLVRYRTHAGNLHSPAHAQDSAEMVARNLRFAGDRQACAVQLAADAARARRASRPVPAAFLDYVAREKAYSDLEQELLGVAWRPARLAKILLAWARRRVGAAAAAKLAALFVSPRCYAPLLWARIRLQRRKREMRHG